MKKKHFFFCGLILVGIGLAFAVWQMRSRTMPPSSRQTVLWQPPRISRPALVSVDPFLPRAVFEAGWRAYGSSRASSIPYATVRGGIVNHHTLALDLLVHFFSELGRCHPQVQRVIILSPDHYFAGSTAVSTLTGGYEVFGKEVEVDKASIDVLETHVPSARVQPSVFVREHGVGALVPFINHIWPNAQLVPLVVRSDLDRATADQLVTWLKLQVRDPLTFLLVSSDMSHYLDEHTALRYDEATRQALTRRDEEFFWKAKDGYTDFGKGIWMALYALGTDVTWKELDHSISTKYGGSAGYTTTYITGFWKDDIVQR